MGPAQFHGLCHSNRGCAMRMTLALGGLAFAMTIAGVPAICGSGCVARAEDTPLMPKPQPDNPGVLPISVEHQLARQQFEASCVHCGSSLLWQAEPSRSAAISGPMTSSTRTLWGRRPLNGDGTPPTPVRSDRLPVLLLCVPLVEDVLGRLERVVGLRKADIGRALQDRLDHLVAGRTAVQRAARVQGDFPRQGRRRRPRR